MDVVVVVIVGDLSLQLEDVRPAIEALAADSAVRQIDLDGGPYRLVIEVDGSHDEHAARLAALVGGVMGDDVTVVSS